MRLESCTSCSIGRKPSAAHYYLNDPDEVVELCQSLRLHSTRANRNRSMGDLPRHERHAAASGALFDWSAAQRTQPTQYFE